MMKTSSFEITLQGMTLTGHKEAGEVLRSILENKKTSSGMEEEIGAYKGFRILFNGSRLNPKLHIIGSNPYELTLQNSDIGNMVRLENLINGLDQSAQKCREQAESCRSEMKNAEMEYEKPFQYEEQLKSALKRQAEINIQLELRDHDDGDVEKSENKRMVVQTLSERNSI